MTMQDLKKMSPEELSRVKMAMVMRGNMTAVSAICDFQKFFNKAVRVVKGRKVPIGTVGVCFWMGQTDYSRYGDPWGIYTKTRIGIRTEAGDVYWTALDNVEIAD